MRGRILLAAVVTLTLLVETSAPTGPVSYRELLLKKRVLERENFILEQEASFASTGEPYILFDVDNAVMDFRIRGWTLKTYSFQGVSYPARPSGASGRVLRIARVGSGGPELVPPDPGAGRKSDAGLLGVEAPTEYTVQTDGNVTIHIGSSAPPSGDDLFVATDAETARSLYHSLMPGETLILLPPLPVVSASARRSNPGLAVPTGTG